MLDNLKTLHDAIEAGLRAKLPAIERIHAYPKIGKAIETPFIAIELAELEPGHDNGTDAVPLVGRMQARVIVDPLVDDAELLVRDLSARVLKAIHHETWGVPVTPGKQIGPASVDPFRPDLDTYLVWLVEWVHEFDLGDEVDSPTPGRTVLWRVASETGPAGDGTDWNPSDQT